MSVPSLEQPVQWQVTSLQFNSWKKQRQTQKCHVMLCLRLNRHYLFSNKKWDFLIVRLLTSNTVHLFITSSLLFCNFLLSFPLCLSVSLSLSLAACLPFISRHLPYSISIFLSLSLSLSLWLPPRLPHSLSVSLAPPARLPKNLAVIPVVFFSSPPRSSFGGLRMSAIQSRPQLRDMNFH